MLLERTDLDPFVLFAALMALIASVWISHEVKASHMLRNSRLNGPTGLVIAATLAAMLAGVWVGFTRVLVPLACFFALASVARMGFRNFSTSGIAWLTVDFFGLIVGGAWSLLFVIETGLPTPVKALGLLGLFAVQLLLVARSLEKIAREAVLTHARWREPIQAVADPSSTYRPKVSIHLPCYAEPPEVVRATMDTLAALDYDNFEVLVCDNNTKDEALWRPLERHAKLLNLELGREVFRFYHVSPLPGAKAGALNFLIGETAEDAELIAVVDADYYSEADFLARLVPFFADEKIAYVQTPHDYRDYEASDYLTGCYWEYMPNNKVDMLGVHEYGGAFTIGTMCILRKHVLEKVGGWAEWCLTEDSEVSVRLRAAGYRGIYIGETFGRGLIPATFDDYRKQRFRWTAGPVQQLVRHWRLFLPQPFAAPLPGWTKMLEVLRCMAPIQTLLSLVFGMGVLTAFTLGALTGMIDPVELPQLVWVLLPVSVAAFLVRTWHRYRLSGCTSLMAMVRGEIARASLSYVVLQAGLAGLSSKPLAWRRTPKFGEGSELAASLAGVRTESVLGAAALLMAAVIFALRGSIGPELGVLMALGLAVLGLRFLAAPYMTWLCWNEQRKDHQPVSPSGEMFSKPA